MSKAQPKLRLTSPLFLCIPDVIVLQTPYIIKKYDNLRNKPNALFIQTQTLKVTISFLDEFHFHKFALHIFCLQRIDDRIKSECLRKE